MPRRLVGRELFGIRPDGSPSEQLGFLQQLDGFGACAEFRDGDRVRLQLIEGGFGLCLS